MLHSNRKVALSLCIVLFALMTITHSHAAPKFTPVWEVPWTADEKPYQQARREVDRARNNRTLLAAMVKKWEPQAQKRLFDHVAQYRWGYALYWLTRARVGEGDAMEYGQIRAAMHRSTLNDGVERYRNRSYEFNRLRFWVEKRSGFSLWKLGERVLKRDGKDVETQSLLLKIWMQSCPLDRKSAALALWKKVEIRYPNDPITIYWQANIYNAAYLANYTNPKRNIADLKRAIALFQQFLRKAPNTARYKSAVRDSKSFVKYNTQFLQKIAAKS